MWSPSQESLAVFSWVLIFPYSDQATAFAPPTLPQSKEHSAVCDRNVYLSPAALPKEGHHIRFSIRDKSLYCPSESF